MKNIVRFCFAAFPDQCLSFHQQYICHAIENPVGIFIRTSRRQSILSADSELKGKIAFCIGVTNNGSRANVTTLSVQTNAVSQENMLGYLLQERDLEFAAEGKRWYDLLRFGRSQNFKYKDQFINMIIENNSTVSASWIRSVLKNTDAWYLPISQGEIDSNPNLIQNPYYDVTAN